MTQDDHDTSDVVATRDGPETDRKITNSVDLFEVERPYEPSCLSVVWLFVCLVGLSVIIS